MSLLAQYITHPPYCYYFFQEFETIWRLDTSQQPDAHTKFCKNLELEDEMRADTEYGDLKKLLIYMQSNKIHKVILMSKFIQHLC